MTRRIDIDKGLPVVRVLLRGAPRLYWRPGVPWGVYGIWWGFRWLLTLNLPLFSIEWELEEGGSVNVRPHGGEGE